MHPRYFAIPIELISLASFDAILLLLFILTLALIFSGVSVKAFGGLIQSAGTDSYPDLSSSIFGEYNYYVLCYNDPFMALGSLFVLLMVNNTFILSKGVEVVTKGSACRIFFMAWYVLGVLFLLNLFSASILTTFMNFWLARHQANSQDGDDEFDAPTRMTTQSDMTLQGNEVENGATLPRKSDNQRLSQILAKNNSLRMRYSNFDDEIFQWVTNFQEPQLPRISQPTQPNQLEKLELAGDIDTTTRSRAETIESLSVHETLKLTAILLKTPTNDSLLNNFQLHPLSDSRQSASVMLEAKANLPYIPEDENRESVTSESSENPEPVDRNRQRSRYLSVISAFPQKANVSLNDREPRSFNLVEWYSYYQNQKQVSVTIVEYTATLLQCAKNGSDKVKFTSRAAYLCYRTTKSVSAFFHRFLLMLVFKTLSMDFVDSVHFNLFFQT